MNSTATLVCSFFSLFSLFLIGCAPSFTATTTAPSVPLLNSERIEQKFGSYDLSLLWQSDSLRVSNLYSTHDGVRTTRTLALVQFSTSAPDPAIASIHRQILAGFSLGATFKKAGWQVGKHRHRFGRYEVAGTSSADSMIRDLMRLGAPANLAFHSYELQVDNGQRTITYAHIVELHHPNYLRLAELNTIYPRTATVGRSLRQSSRDIASTLPRLLEPAAAKYNRSTP